MRGSGYCRVAKLNKRRFCDALGRCALWKCAATFVYIAYPKGIISKAPLLERLGIGFLEVDLGTGSTTEIVKLPKAGESLFAVLELHPLDFQKQQYLIRQIEAAL